MTAELSGHTAQRYVTSDDAQIAVYEQGNAAGPTVVLAHGWPDTHALWDDVIPLLTEHFRVVTYDNRGAGNSSAPHAYQRYTMERFADDFGAVIDELSPGEPVHVLGHDWGSSAVWEYLTRPGAGDRVASFTSTSGPSGGHLRYFVRDGLKRPYLPKRFAGAVGQAGRVSFMALFSTPVVAPAVMRSFGADLVRKAFIEPSVPKGSARAAESYLVDAANGMKIYRANFLASPAAAGQTVDVPVQVIVNTKDPVIRPHLYDDLDRWVTNLWRRDIRAGHWSPLSHPQVLAAAVADMAEMAAGRPASRALRRAEVGRDRKPFEDTLVSVTGAGSGIGRATAVEFARLGAEVVISDINEDTVRATAVQIAEQGGIAHAFTLDVSDADAVEAFAEEVSATHGVPDIVVNNAGIGAAGAFFDTTPEQFDRVLNINLGGVVNCCRSFGRRLIEQGTGGHVVNVASMAAYAPLSSLSAYCTSKAAVFMFSDCLRAELDAAGVMLTTICPGVVDTNIIQSTEMNAPKGKGGRDIAGRRAQLEKMFALRRYPPEKVAKAIVTSVQKKKPIRPVTPEAYMLYGTSKLMPQAMRNFARARVL